MRPEHWLYTAPLRLRSIFRRRRVESEMEEELRFHLEHKTEEGIAEGLTPEEARRRALRFILAQPQMTVVIPTITNEDELREYAGAAHVADLTDEELARVDELYARNFDVQPVSA